MLYHKGQRVRAKQWLVVPSNWNTVCIRPDTEGTIISVLNDRYGALTHIDIRWDDNQWTYVSHNDFDVIERI